MTVDRTPPGERGPEPTDGRKRPFTGLIVGAGALLLLFSGCTANLMRSSQPDADVGDASTVVTEDTVKYIQTWPKDYSSTTCQEWLDEMSASQQFAAAADMLTGSRDKVDGGTGVAPDALIYEFEAGITKVCVVPTWSLTDAGAGLYVTERTRFAP